MDSAKIDISIIIVNYKSWTHLEQCLLSIREIDKKDFKFEVIIIDNCSNDGKLDKFSDDFLEFNFIENTGNNGFSNGCNTGAKVAKGIFLLFLNPDTLISKESLIALLHTAQKYPEYKLISCGKRNSNGVLEKTNKPFPSLISLFGLTRALNKVLNKKLANNCTNNEDKIIFPNWLSGSLILMSRNWFDKLGGWNEDYWMYYEDVDLGKRTNNLNGTIALIMNESIIHNHGGASRINMKTSALTKSEVIISRHIYISNHFTGFERIAVQVLLVLNNIFINLVIGITGLIFFFIPKLTLYIYLFINIIKYYISALKGGTWLSVRSMKYPERK